MADVVIARHLDKRVLIKLKDRITSKPPRGMSPGGSGFELEIDWMGHGVRTVFLPTPFGSMEFEYYEAVGIEVEQIEYNGQIEYSLAVKYTDINGYGQVEISPMQPLTPLLENAFNQY